MNNGAKTKAHLLDELAHLRRRVADLEAAEARHKLASRALQETEDLYRITMENISDPIFLTDEDGKFTFICPNVQHLLGYPVEEIEALGNISALLGDGLITPKEPEGQGEIRRIERVITDKAGGERLFLVMAKQIPFRESPNILVR